ncbi:MAG: response regulator transcription factor, partial [Pyrinomonadaceae bacterium]|nr:response regulator transcription factor [Pyrinomonadaceae bacterium]
MLTTRIVLVDDHRVLLDALRCMVEPEFQVVGLFEDCRSMLEQVAEIRPEIVVLDIGMPLMDGLSAAEHLKKVVPKARLVFLTANEDPVSYTHLRAHETA